MLAKVIAAVTLLWTFYMASAVIPNETPDAMRCHNATVDVFRADKDNMASMTTVCGQVLSICKNATSGGQGNWDVHDNVYNEDRWHKQFYRVAKEACQYYEIPVFFPIDDYHPNP